MWDLTRAELRRFRWWALAALLLHLGVLAFFTKLVDLLQQPRIVYQVGAACYGAIGLLLGAYQMAGYRRPNTWLQLLHRPLSTSHIMSALVIACGLLLALAIALPMVITLAGQLSLTARVVDSRHWWLPLAGWLIACGAYLAGAYTMLAPKRYSWMVLVAPLLLYFGDASGVSAISVQLLALLWLLALLAIAFKPDLTAEPSSSLAEAATAVPLQLAIYCVLALGAMAFQLGLVVVGKDPLNGKTSANTYLDAARTKSSDLLTAGLADSAHPEAELWREQAEISEVAMFSIDFEALPQRHELTNIAPMEFDDDERQIRWVFSHDRMRYQGVSLRERRREGELGVGAEGDAFPLPALALGAERLVTARTIYDYDTHTAQLHPRIVLPIDETLAMKPDTLGAAAVVLSDRALYVFDGRALARSNELIEPRLRFALPGRLRHMHSVSMMELLDGYLVSIIYGRGSVDGAFDSWQTIWQLRPDGEATEVARRALAHDYPMTYRHYSWWISPAMHWLSAQSQALFSATNPLEQRDRVDRPRAMVWLASCLMLISLVASIWMVRTRAVPTARRWPWVLVCGLVGAPALLALWLLRPERQLPERSSASAVRAAPAGRT